MVVVKQIYRRLATTLVGYRGGRRPTGAVHLAPRVAASRRHPRQPRAGLAGPPRWHPVRGPGGTLPVTRRLKREAGPAPNTGCIPRAQKHRQKKARKKKTYPLKSKLECGFGFAWWWPVCPPPADAIFCRRMTSALFLLLFPFLLLFFYTVPCPFFSSMSFSLIYICCSFRGAFYLLFSLTSSNTAPGNSYIFARCTWSWGWVWGGAAMTLWCDVRHVVILRQRRGWVWGGAAMTLWCDVRHVVILRQRWGWVWGGATMTLWCDVRHVVMWHKFPGAVLVDILSLPGYHCFLKTFGCVTATVAAVSEMCFPVGLDISDCPEFMNM